MADILSGEKWVNCFKMTYPVSLENESWNQLGWGFLKQFPTFHCFPNFQHHRNTRLILNITVIFDRCRRSSAAVTPVKYKCYSENLKGTFARSKTLFTEKLTNGALVSPSQFPVSSHWVRCDTSVQFNWVGRFTELMYCTPGKYL